MKGVRVVATLVFPNAEIADQAVAGMVEAFRPKQKEDGALQYELFRSIEHPEKVVLHEHWASKELYDKHWREQVEREGLPDLSQLSDVKVEFYQHANYSIVDGIWQPSEPTDRISTIRWA